MDRDSRPASNVTDAPVALSPAAVEGLLSLFGAPKVERAAPPAPRVIEGGK